MALTAAYAAALLSRRSFHMMFDRDDALLSSIDFLQFPPSALLTPTTARAFPCLARAASIEDPPLSFVRPRKGEPVAWLRKHVVSGLNDEVAWLGRLADVQSSNVSCVGGSVLYVSGAPALQLARDEALRSSEGDHGGVWGMTSVVVYSSYDSFWGALMERPATGMLLKRLLLPLQQDGGADIGWAAARAHERAWLAFGAFASAVIAPSDHVIAVQQKAVGIQPSAAPATALGIASPHCSRMACAQCLGVAVRRGRSWNSDYIIVDDAGEARMLACARAWLHNATRDATSTSAVEPACVFVAADDSDVLQRWSRTLAQGGAHVVFTPGSDGSHTGTQHVPRAGVPPARAVHHSYKDWFSLACCSRDALLSDNSSFGYSAIALAVQRWLREGAALHDVTPLMQQPPPAPSCARQLWRGHMCPAPPPLKSGTMIPC